LEIDAHQIQCLDTVGVEAGANETIQLPPMTKQMRS
jgi:hypothetical protein